jgi:hypothetical protein
VTVAWPFCRRAESLELTKDTKQGTYEGSYRLELMEHRRRLLGAWASPEEVEDWDLEVVRVQELVGNNLGGCPLQL